MKFDKEQKEIIQAINNKEVYDIESFVKKFGYYEKFVADIEQEKNYEEIEKGKMLEIEFLDSLFPEPVVQRIEVPGKLQLEEETRDIVFEGKRYKYKLWNENGFLIATSIDKIVGFISIWEYLKNELEILEIDKEVSKTELELFFKKNKVQEGRRTICVSNYNDEGFVYRSASLYIDEDIKADEEQLKIWKKYFTKRILPTPTLNKYIANGFKTEEEKTSKQSLIVAVIAIIISIITFGFTIYTTYNVDSSENNLKTIQQELKNIEEYLRIKDNDVHNLICIVNSKEKVLP